MLAHAAWKLRETGTAILNSKYAALLNFHSGMAALHEAMELLEKRLGTLLYGENKMQKTMLETEHRHFFQGITIGVQLANGLAGFEPKAWYSEALFPLVREIMRREGFEGFEGIEKEIALWKKELAEFGWHLQRPT